MSKPVDLYNSTYGNFAKRVLAVPGKYQRLESNPVVPNAADEGLYRLCITVAGPLIERKRPYGRACDQERRVPPHPG